MKSIVDFALKVILFFGVCAVVTWGTFLYLASHGYWPGKPNFQVHHTAPASEEVTATPAALPVEHELLLSTLVPVESPEVAGTPGAPAVEPAPAPAKAPRFLLVALQAHSDAEEGVAVAMEALGYAESCAGAPAPGRRTQRSWHPGFSGGEALTANWCIPVQEGTTLFKRTFEDAWAADSLYPDVNYEVEYLVMKDPDGTSRALKLVSLAVCDDLGCGRVASVELGPDDRKLEQLLPIDDGEYVAGAVSARATVALGDSEAGQSLSTAPAGFQPVNPTL